MNRNKTVLPRRKAPKTAGIKNPVGTAVVTEAAKSMTAVPIRTRSTVKTSLLKPTIGLLKTARPIRNRKTAETTPAADPAAATTVAVVGDKKIIAAALPISTERRPKRIPSLPKNCAR